MKYKIYYKQDKCNSLFKGDKCLLNMYKAGRHIWPEDNTDIDFTIIRQGNSCILNYSISNLSDRTQYLYDQNMLGLGLFVIENKRNYINPRWRSSSSKARHPNRKCIQCWSHIDLQGNIDIGPGPYSDVLQTIFDASASWEDPYREDGYDTLYIGIGRSCDSGVYFFRPHKISEYGEEVTCYNR